MQHSLYNSYEAWKGWDQLFSCPPEQALYFLGETRDCKISDSEVLEIGFGSGSFLAWAKEHGAKVAGTEINERLLKAAQDFGVEVLPADFETVAKANAGRFATIAAFDVFEHFSLDEIVMRLKAIDTMLKPGGHVILRFPNAQSPFGLAPQNGDPTHITALSRSVFEPLIQPMALEIIRYDVSFRITGGGWMRSIVRHLRYLGRDIISTLLNFIYAQDILWDPVVVLILRKSQQASPTPRESIDY